jgi:hypothetical protein
MDYCHQEFDLEEVATVSETGMLRNNGAKLPVELVPPEADLIASAIYGFGEAKYDTDNWRKGGSWRKTIGCLKRHLSWFELGEDNDPDSGITHLSNMLFNINTLVAFWATGTGTDDRHKLTPEQLATLHRRVDETAAAMKAGIDAYNAKKAPAASTTSVTLKLEDQLKGRVDEWPWYKPGDADLGPYTQGGPIAATSETHKTSNEG